MWWCITTEGKAFLGLQYHSQCWQVMMCPKQPQAHFLPCTVDVLPCSYPAAGAATIQTGPWALLEQAGGLPPAGQGREGAQ